MPQNKNGGFTIDDSTDDDGEFFRERMEFLIAEGRLDEANKLVDERYPDDEVEEPAPKSLAALLPKSEVRDLSSLKRDLKSRSGRG